MSTWNKHYHWKTKGVTPWAKAHFKEKLVGITAEAGKGGQVKIDSISSFEGDVELGNRKGKLITIYDCAMTLAWSGTTEDGTSANGTITFPEVSHEVEDDGAEYQFETEMTSASSDATRSLYDAVRNQLAPSLRPVFHAFREVLIETHAKDLGHDTSPSVSGTSTPASAAPSAAAPATASAPSSSPAPSKPTSSSKIATSSTDVRVTSQLAISTEDLWDLLTNPARIPMWTRAPAEFEAKADTKFALFGGNITGTIVTANPPTQLIQKWRTPQFPDGHYGTLAINLTQGDDSTRLELCLSGVPLGEEEAVEKNLEAYYIRGLKSMGLGTIL
ncbi:hypothetical protein IE53DRAFT_389653 [Violaceomyces palustris]|uniref:Uncharacterized protein n=1 Tax=Violaceomyces palustris TaxID=1673888 RepID=A0ACD0NQT8_9BASI|nr:hypothetical protein IE53DRAFT_389653 [Violaceomyces palustris]